MFFKLRSLFLLTFASVRPFFDERFERIQSTLRFVIRQVAATTNQELREISDFGIVWVRDRRKEANGRCKSDNQGSRQAVAR